MALPHFIVNWLDQESKSVRQSHYQDLSQTYKLGQVTPSAAIYKASYMQGRFPATFAVIERVLQELPVSLRVLQSHLDIGAGPGTVSTAAYQVGISIASTLLIEPDPLWAYYQEELSRILGLEKKWACMQSAWSEKLFSGKLFDLVTCAYAAIEIMDHSSTFIENLWDSTGKILIVIEPGTPQGYQNIIRIRDYILSQQGILLAPCPHHLQCPLKNKTEKWCHFKVRLHRHKTHQRLKNGTLNFEDEKYSYLIASRNQPIEYVRPLGRLIGHPHQHKGHLTVEMCEVIGQASVKTISKAQKDLYKVLRHSNWGDVISGKK